MKRIVNLEKRPQELAEVSKKITVRRGPNYKNWKSASAGNADDDSEDYQGDVAFYSDGLHLSWTTGTDKRGNRWEITIPSNTISQWVSAKLNTDKAEKRN